LILQTLVYVNAAPAGYTEQTVTFAVDGDTYEINADNNNDGKKDRVRVNGINTTEFGKGGDRTNRMKKAEEGAVKAWGSISEIFTQAQNKVFIIFGKQDSYHRTVTSTYANFENHLQNVAAHMMYDGMGHAYFVTIEDPIEYSSMLFLQRVAKTNQRGIWQLSEFAEDKPIHITSFHSDAKPAGNNEEPLDGEYLRIANTSNEPINLQSYKLYNAVARIAVPFSDYVVPPGRTVRIVTGVLTTNADPARELVYSLDQSKPFWENENEGGVCAEIVNLTGEVIDFAAKYGMKCPQDYRPKQ